MALAHLEQRLRGLGVDQLDVGVDAGGVRALDGVGSAVRPISRSASRCAPASSPRTPGGPAP